MNWGWDHGRLQTSLGGTHIVHFLQSVSEWREIWKVHQRLSVSFWAKEREVSLNRTVGVCGRGGGECGLPGPWGLCGSGVIREEGSGTVLGFGLRKAAGCVQSLPALPPGGRWVKVWIQVYTFSLWNQTPLPFSFHGFGGNR